MNNVKLLPTTVHKFNISYFTYIVALGRVIHIELQLT